ncbi:discoidin domain-containing protein [Agromyces sp. NPDC056379]|uniref:discoidin domain-containing protein n=1 Tax=unclassified Agromyces TaxID=2639701 RepID=UPI0035DDC676
MKNSRTLARLLGVALAATVAIAPVVTADAAWAAPAATKSLPALNIYVSPDAKGLQLGTKKHPFKTLEKARSAVRLVNRHMITDINVRLLDGTYRLKDTFTLTSRDSGSNGRTITWEAAAGAEPVISGGTPVTKWKVSDEARGIWSANVGEVDARQLYVDGAPATRARSGENPGGFSKTENGYAITDPAMQSWRNQSDIEVASSWGWKLQRCLVDTITADRMIMQQPCWHNAHLQQGQEIQNPTWLENAYELLDEPGEWYLDKAEQRLYYLPQDGKNPNDSEVVLPRVQSLVELAGTIDKPVKNVAFEGLTFSHSTWLEPSSPDGLIEGQAGFRMIGEGNPTFDSTRLYWKKTPGAVNVGYGHDIAFEDNVFTHLGAVGLNLNTGTQGTDIIGNVFRDVAATGVQIGGTDIVDHHPDDQRSVTKNTTVRNNLITDVATNYRGSVGILAGYTERTVIEHNRIYDLPYSGISVGWGWGLTDKGGNENYLPENGGITPYPTDTPSRETIVRYNHISDIMRKQADGGAIYTLSNAPESIVAGNLITDVPHAAYGAIYHDEASSKYRTFNNAFCDIEFQWLLVNRGIGVDVQRNFTTSGRFSTQGNTVDSLVANNALVEGCEQLPASVVNNAGLEADYRHLDPQEPAADTTRPSKPGAIEASALFPTIAELSWEPADDDTAVTGYSVFLDGELVSASKKPEARLTGLEVGREYQVTITARDAAANESEAGPGTALTMPATPNAAVGKDVTASSFSDANLPELAFDGDLSTRWAQGRGLPDPSWIQVDLGAEYDIDGLITSFELSSGYRYRLQASVDEVEWITLDDHTGENTTAAANYTSLEQSVRGRYVRLDVTGTSGNGGSIYELEVYGAEAAPNEDTEPPAVPDAPKARILLPSVVELSWTPPAGDPASYELWNGDTRVAVTTATTYRLSGLAPESAHSFTIVARDAALNRSEPSGATAVTMPADTNLATGRPVTASSFSEPNLPALAVDGDPGTRWAQGIGMPDPSWIRIDLGSAIDVSSVVSVFELPRGYAYRLESSLDGETWTTFDDRTGRKTTQHENVSIADEPVSMRYLRLTVTDSSWNGGSLWEIKVYGDY